MKLTLHSLIPIAGLALALPALQAADNATPEKQVRKEVRVLTAPVGEPASGGAKIERKLRFVGGPEAGPGEMETVTFLGVSTRPLDETLSEQFGLPKETGLVVAMVSEESPAAVALKAHDILMKFNDQILIDQHQLSVLVRNQKPGDEVTLTYIRGGKQATAQVKLGQTERPKMAMFQRAFPGPGPMGGNMQWFGTAPGMAAREDVDQLLGLIDLGKDGPPGLVRHNQVGGDRMISVTVDTKDSNLNFSDDKGSLEVKTKDGKKELTAKNEKGEVIFSGPINTPEERKALPPEVAERLGKIESMQGFSFKTDGDFEGGEVKVVRPLGRGISLRKAPVIQLVPRSTAF